MWRGRSGIAYAAAASAFAAASFVPWVGRAETYRINNVDHATRIHMRQSASNQSKVIAYIPPQSELNGTGKCDARWCEVTFKGHTGWVFRKYLTEVKGVEQRQAQADRPVAALPKPDETPKAVPPDLQDTILKLIFTNGQPIPVYAYPGDHLPESGRIAPDTEKVEDLGTCTRSFCYVRAGSLVGWIREEAIAKDHSSGATSQETAPKDQTAAITPALNNTVPTATTATGQPGSLEPPGSVETKTYTLAGLSDDGGLAVRDGPADSAAILGWIPGNASSVEGLRKCVMKWCLVRYEGLTGWVARRHLADENTAANKRYQVNGVALWGALDVVDYPGPEAEVVGHIPSYATGIVPIGNCDNNWCHIRYLGIAGWVAGKYLAQQGR
jgi:SH3-like domain-containing protein